MANSAVNERASLQQHPESLYVSGGKCTTGYVRFSSGILGNFAGSWTLENFSSLSSGVGDSHWSGVFHASEGVEWQLRIYPGGRYQKSEGLVSCMLVTNTDFSKHGAAVKFFMSFGNVEGEIIEEFYKNGWTNTSNKGQCGMKDVISRRDLISELKDDTLVIHVHASYSLTSLVLEDEKHHRSELSSFAELVDDFDSLYNETDESDAVIRVQGIELGVHHAVLASRSDAITDMLTDEDDDEEEVFQRPTKRVLKIDEFKPNIVRLMVEFLYTGAARGINHLNAPELLKIADKFQLDSLKELCSNILMCHTNASNVFETLVSAKKAKAYSLQKNALALYCENKSSINLTEHRALLDQNPDILYDIINKLSPGSSPGYPT